MNKGLIKILGSITFVVLFVFCADARVISCRSDTIIIDGKHVEVNRVVEYTDEAPETEVEEKKDSPPPKRHFGYVRAELLAGPMLVRERGIPEGMTSVNALVDEPGRVRPFCGRFVALKGWKFGDNSVEVGGGFSLASIKNQFFRESSLHDSLWQFASSTQGSFEQILRYSYDIGVEYDTLVTPLIQSNLSYLTLDLPLRFSHSWQLDRNNWLDVRIGLTMHYSVNFVGGPVILVGSDTKYTVLGSEEITPSKLRFSAMLSAEWKRSLKHRVPSFSGVGVYFNPVLIKLLDVGADVNYQTTRFGLTASFNVFSGLNKNKTKQSASL